MIMQNTAKLKYKGKTPIRIGGMLKITVLKKGDIYDCTELQAQRFVEHAPDKWERVDKPKSEKAKNKKSKNKGGKK